MRSADVTQSEMFSYRTLEQRIPASHPLRKLRALVDGILAALHADFEALYAKTGRPSIPPERLLRASLIQTLYSIRSERQLVQHIDYNLLYRWFVGLNMDDKVWDHSTFRGSKPKPQKFPSSQIKVSHERVQVDHLAIALEGVMPVEQDVPPSCR